MPSKTKLNLIIGNPLEQSLSPQIHNFVYQKLELQDRFKFSKKSLEAQELEGFVKSKKFENLTVTIPFKEKIISLLDAVDSRAKKIQAVNTVIKQKNQQGKDLLVGYNTDWLGGLIPIYEKVLNKKFNYNSNQDLENLLASKFLENQKVILFGAGGAGRALGYGVLEVGAGLVIVNRTLSKAEKLKSDLKKLFPDAKITAVASASQGLSRLIKDSKVLINSTSLGMLDLKHKSPLNLPEDCFLAGSVFFDAVYKPLKTKFLQQGEKAGAKLINGLEMLVWQAVFQFQLQTKEFAKVDYFWQSLDF